MDSVTWADEIIIVDSGSTDETLQICQEFPVTIVVNTHWQGFGYQKNLALQHSTCNWVLSLDADERISDQLRETIIEAINSVDADAYLLPRQAYFLGKEMRHGGWWPDYVLRLFRRDLGRFTDVLVHETIEVNGNTKTLHEPIIHYSYTSLEQLLTKINKYSSAGAKEAQKKRASSGLGKALFRGSWAFFRAYCLRLGFLDGSAGFISAISKAEETYYRHLKLSYLIK